MSTQKKEKITNTHEVISIYIPFIYKKRLQNLIEAGVIHSQSAGIRNAIKDLLEEDFETTLFFANPQQKTESDSI
ncbi:MAG: hypothetical protein GF317_16030 [Candidatus Lokiarchaeota archaeon]|nr:hypothetical protein [Candidatus Lokiarchaeota archaeon]